MDMLSPGIYLQEADYSEYVPSTSPSIIGCVGEAKRGPIGVPTLITSQKELLEIFGTPTEGEYGIYSALQTLTHASQLYYVRVVRSATKAKAGKNGVDKIIYTTLMKGTEGNGIKIQQIVNTDGTFNLKIYKETEESDVEATYNYTVDTTVTSENFAGKVETGLYIKVSDDNYQEVSASDAFDSSETYYTREVATEPSTISEPVILEEYNNLSTDKTATNFVSFILAANSQYLSAEVLKSGSVTDKILETSGAVNSGSNAKAGNPETDKLLFRTKYFDSTLNGGKVTISDPDSFGYFNIILSDISGEVVEQFNSVTLDIADDRYVGQLINTRSNRIVVEINDNDLIPLEGDTLTFLGGDDGVVGISDEDIIGEEEGNGIQALSNPELISVDVLIVPGRTSENVINAAIEMCTKRGDTFFIADTPFGMSPRDVVDWSNGEGAFNDHVAFDTSYSAFYWPWIKVADSYTKQNIWLPPSGFIADKYAYNDVVAYPWVAPAGIVRGKITNVLGIEKSPTKNERDLLYGNRNIINPIANFQSDGLVIWGQKTMQRRPTALDRINVRRLLCYLKRVVGNATRSFVFEQNNSSTWEEWKTLVNPILKDVKSAGGMYEYKISINPTPQDIENNIMPIFIYVKPTKSAEYIPITFNIMPYSASFAEE